MDNSSAKSPKNEKYGDVPTTLRMMQKIKQDCKGIDTS
nr:hypothetical protein Iba_chr02bCG13860 [Ipomoea batatas]